MDASATRVELSKYKDCPFICRLYWSKLFCFTTSFNSVGLNARQNVINLSQQSTSTETFCTYAIELSLIYIGSHSFIHFIRSVTTESY